MIRINLLPVRVSKKKEAGKQQLILFALVLVLGIIGNSFWSGSRASELSGLEAKLKRTREDITQLDRIIGEVKNIKAQQAALKEKLDVLEKLKAGRSGPVRMLDELATITPRKLWLKKLEDKAGVVTFDGAAASIDDISAFMTALKGSKYFSGVELKKTAAKMDDKLRVMDFQIIANVNYAPAAPPVVAAAPAR
jgi:type IV pilus assembly protein PilN